MTPNIATTYEVASDEADTRLDRWLRRRFPHATQGAIQKWCRTGQIRVDGKRVEAATRLTPGQQVRLPPVPLPNQPAPRKVQELDPHQQRDLEQMVLYRDDHVIVLNKPPGLATQGGPGITRHLDGMLDGLRFGSDDRPRLVHRLDRDTSGVLLLARTPGVAAKLAAAFRGRTVKKIYWAIVAGRPVPVEGEIDLPLMRIAGPQGERTAPAPRNHPEAASAITEYRTLDHAARKLAWLELQPLTGRTHQLRVHCQALQAPILGDGKYGGAEAHVEGLPGQLHLHARALILPHPAGGRLQVVAPLPPHMRESFATLGFSAPAVPKPTRL